ncbi:MAG: metallo-mystery pair system four-Cys motif protein [Gemmatimonadaceae bacterium]|nr:metallo-mystery pair system four-Cys motif protein [Gemmatimonadaceae bacterium]
MASASLFFAAMHVASSMTLSHPKTPSASADSLVPVTVRVRGMVGDTPFECGKSYAGVGTSRATITASDFRFYVHNVRLVRANGDTVSARMQPIAPWQDTDVALLDFENGAATCANGTPELRQEITVLAPAGNYKGVAFSLGVPFARNHGDLAAQPAPLSLSRLFWSWNGGYKFLRVDMRTTQGDSAATGWMVHLGSAGCTGEAGAKSPKSCAQPNRADVRLSNFDPSRDVVIADLAALLSRSDVRRNQPQTAQGCMSAPNDADCGGLFASLGLSHPSSTGADTPPFFRVGRLTSAVQGGAP